MKRTLIILLVFVAAVVAVVTAKFYLDARQGNTLFIYNVAASAALGGKPGVEIEVYSPRAFPTGSSSPVLQIGSKVYTVSNFKNGDPHTLIFTLTPDEFANTVNESLVTAHYEPDTQGHWDFGFLEKNWSTGQRR